jgi:gliding motility-associated-like protein
MKYIYCIFISFSVANSTHGQLNNLCGIWIAHGYQCSTPSNGFSFLTEVILIEQDSTYTIATKLIGDDCVNAGQITWEGNADSSTFNVTFTLGIPTCPGCGQGPGTIVVKDSDHIASVWGYPNYTRATCAQIDSLVHYVDLPQKACVDCDLGIRMPNVFTPNHDGINDNFIPLLDLNIYSSELFIFNRWGNQIFNSKDIHTGWNGQSDNKDCSDGVYFWIVEFHNEKNDKRTIKGIVSLVR